MNTATLERVSPEEARKAIAIAAVRLKHRAATAASFVPFTFQMAPPQPWDVWAFIAGRGAGKTEGGARAMDQHANGPACLPGKTPHRMALIAPSHPDAVNTCVRGESGLLQANPSIAFRPGSELKADLTWPNGSEAELFGAFAPEDVERLRGPQHCYGWLDEFATWRKLDDAWSMYEFGLRLGPNPRTVITTTPKRRAKLREILEWSTTVITRATTDDNPHLPESRRRALYARYGGTVLGRQELLAELIDDVPGALWSREMIEYRRVPLILRGGVEMPNLTAVVVAIDPAVTFDESSDETGIVVDAIAADGNGYALADLSGRMPPITTDGQGWANVAVAAYHRYGADRIVAEANNGGELVRTVIATVDSTVPVHLVHASRGKVTRAEPVSALYVPNPMRAMRWYHAEPLPDLEDQMCSYMGHPNESSPDRMDAHVWAVTDLADLGAKDGWGSGAWGGSVAAVNS